MCKAEVDGCIRYNQLSLEYCADQKNYCTNYLFAGILMLALPEFPKLQMQRAALRMSVQRGWLVSALPMASRRSVPWDPLLMLRSRL